jgi:anti-anti-sigma factor
MEITRSERDGCLELAVKGRLDGYWAQHLTAALDDVMREGIHRARLNLAQTTYISSAGIRVLVQAYKQFGAVAGSLGVVEPSPSVRQVLELAGLGQLLAAPAAAAPAAAADAPQRRAAAGCLFEIYEAEPHAALVCRPAGTAAFAESGCQTLALGTDIFALGVGAFGEGYSACRERFGEFLAVAGNAACQPTDGTNCADYMVASGGFVPRITALAGIACRGRFGKLLRFESDPASGPAALSGIVETCLEAAGGAPAGPAGIVMVAESAGLLGASLKRSPAGGAPSGTAGIFAHPGVRDWISFSPERGHARSVAVVAGVAAPGGTPPPGLAPMLRPIGGASGHFHAAVFGYHPLQKGRIALQPTVSRLFDTGGIKAVLHLLHDDRAASAVESEFLRGACWVGPIERILGPEETL